MAQATARRVYADEFGLGEAARLVAEGGIIAYPTDTVFGLGCNPFDSSALQRLVEVKKRANGSLPILVNSMASARKLGELNKTSMKLAGRFWPGPLTLVVPSKEQMPSLVTDGTSSVGIRIPKHETALSLLNSCGGRLIGTSANISGHPSHLIANEVLSELGDHVDLVLEGGPAPSGKESTVAKVIGSGVEVLREGAISRDDIFRALRTG